MALIVLCFTWEVGSTTEHFLKPLVSISRGQIERGLDDNYVVSCVLGRKLQCGLNSCNIILVHTTPNAEDLVIIPAHDLREVSLQVYAGWIVRNHVYPT